MKKKTDPHDPLAGNAMKGDLLALKKKMHEEEAARAKEARSRAEDSIRAAREALGEAGEEAIERTREAVESADEYVHENPWTAIGIAAGIGLVVGMLLTLPLMQVPFAMALERMLANFR